MENDLGCVNIQPQISEFTRGFGYSAATDNPDSGYYMEIQDVAISGTDSVVGGERATGAFHENDHTSVSIVKAADENDLMDNAIYESFGGMVVVANESRHDKPISFVKGADETD